jgi:hypothetical protein
LPGRRCRRLPGRGPAISHQLGLVVDELVDGRNIGILTITNGAEQQIFRLDLTALAHQIQEARLQTDILFTGRLDSRQALDALGRGDGPLQLLEIFQNLGSRLLDSLDFTPNGASLIENERVAHRTRNDVDVVDDGVGLNRLGEIIVDDGMDVVVDLVDPEDADQGHHAQQQQDGAKPQPQSRRNLQIAHVVVPDDLC